MGQGGVDKSDVESVRSCSMVGVCSHEAIFKPHAVQELYPLLFMSVDRVTI